MTHKSHIGPKAHPARLTGGTFGRSIVVLSRLAAPFGAPTTLAGWNAQPEMIVAHPGRIYTPASALAGSDGRVYGCVLFNLWACAKGSGENRGLNLVFRITSKPRLVRYCRGFSILCTSRVVEKGRLFFIICGKLVGSGDDS